MVQGQVFLKGRRWHFSNLIFSRFIILHLEISLNTWNARFELGNRWVELPFLKILKQMPHKGEIR